MTMKITVKGYLTLKPIIGGSEDIQVTDDAWTLIDLLAFLASKHGESFNQAVFDAEKKALSMYAKILINGRHYTHLPHRLDTELRDGDVVSLFPMMAGG
jgi:molybdopterin converting factor small subunit